MCYRERVELSPPDPRIGQVLQGRYRILARVAAGAMGVVYRGERLELGRSVAVKFLHPWIAAQQAFRTRFETEARAMSRLAHPNCVSVIDFGVEGSPYVVMDFVAGTTLRQSLEGGALAPARAVAIARQLLAGVAHAHAQDIIHRDLKPENLILGDTAGLADHVRILDFGLAKLRDGPAMTSGLAIGTPSYMSPEQAGAPGNIDGRTDIYAVGVLLFEMLAGRKPFVSDKIADILLMHRDTSPPSLRTLVPQAGISAELDAVVQRALAKAPQGRFQTAGEFVQALDRVPEATVGRGTGTFPTPPTFAEPLGHGGATRPTTARPPARPAAGVALPPPADADQTIADPVPGQVLPAVPSQPIAAGQGGDGPRAVAGVLSSPIPAAPAPTADRSGAVGLTRGRIIGLAAVALVGTLLVVIGVRRRPDGKGTGDVRAVAGSAPKTGGAAAGKNGAKPSDPTVPATARSGAATEQPAPTPTPPATDQRLEDAERLIAAGEWEQALVVLDKARRENPGSAEAAYQYANLALEHKRWAQGAQSARAAVERDAKYRGDERLVKNLISAFASDKGYEKTEDVLQAFGAGAVPFLKDAAAHDKNPLVRQRAAEVLRSRDGSRGTSRANVRGPGRKSGGSFFSR